MENKKAITSAMLIIAIFFFIVLLVCMAIFSYGFSIADETISTLDFQVGNTSFNDTYQSMVHPSMEVLSVSAPRNISIGTMIGMVLIMMFIGMKSDKKSNLWIMLDLFIIIVAEIIAVAIKIYFENYIINLSPEFYQIFITTLSDGSKWILNLPIIIPTMGALLMVATYILKREDQEEESDGFLQP